MYTTTVNITVIKMYHKYSTRPKPDVPMDAK